MLIFPLVRSSVCLSKQYWLYGVRTRGGFETDEAFMLISIQLLKKVKLLSSSQTAINKILMNTQQVMYSYLFNMLRKLNGKRLIVDMTSKCSKYHSFLFGYDNFFIWKYFTWFSDCFQIFIFDLLEQRMDFVMQHDLFHSDFELFILVTLHAIFYIINQTIIKVNLQYKVIYKLIDLNFDLKFSHMNKSHSQSKLPKTKSNFIYQIEDETFVFQTKTLFMQVQFSSPIKEIFDYLQQLSKYSFLEELSSVGIKAAQYNQYYQQISNKVDSEYRKFLEKTMAYVEEMIMGLHFLKVQRWNMYKQIVKGYKTQLLDKELDCYNFNSSQLMEDQKKVLEYLGKINKIKDAKESTLIKVEIKKKKKVIEDKAKQFNEKSFVKNPFRAQNCRKSDIYSDEVFSSYMKKMVVKSFSVEQALDLYFYNAYEGLRKFPEYVIEMSTKEQRIAYSIIKEYNRSPESYFNSKLNNLQRSDIDMSDFNTGWKKTSKKISILQNNIQKLEFSNRLICRDEQTKADYSLSFLPSEKYRAQASRVPEYYDTLQGRIPANNPYFNYWDHVYDREKLKRLYFYFEEPKKNRSLGNSSNNIANRIRKKMKKERKNAGENIFKTLMEERRSQQAQIWQNMSSFQNHQKNTVRFWKKAYENVEQREDRKFEIVRKLQINQDKDENKITRKQRKVEIYKQYLQKYDKDRKKDDDLLGSLRKNKAYHDYVNTFGIKDPKLYVGPSQILRYGIEIMKSLYENTNFAKLQEFLCHFLKEKLFREDGKYKDKQLMPLIQNLKPVEQFCDWRVIKKLGQLTQSFKKYYIWASELIKFEEITTINKQTIAKFTIYSYTDVKNSQSILFQLKRRLNVKVIGEIVQKYNTLGVYTIQSIMSKLQVMHRLLFNQHLETPTAEFSYLKGQHIFSLILKQIATDGINEQKLQ